MQTPETLGEAAIAVLSAADPVKKVKRAHETATAWASGDLKTGFPKPPPDRPARPEKPELLMPGAMPKRRKGGSIGNRIALLHAVAHIEFNAIDLAFDMVARFGDGMPREFLDDWICVGDDEARHFTLITNRLRALGADYGDLPAHDGLWQAAQDTAHDLAARLAVVPMVLEARGLDVTPAMIDRMARMGDTESADVLQTIYTEEVAHVAAGQRWFAHICGQKNRDEPSYFQELVGKHFKGLLKPPFNHPARAKAGMSPAHYEPLASTPSR